MLLDYMVTGTGLCHDSAACTYTGIRAVVIGY